MQDIALGLRMGPRDIHGFVEAGHQRFEPTYYYYYRSLAYYLMPQWNGDGRGMRLEFAEESANHVGGDAGDILYFQIGEKIVCACNRARVRTSFVAAAAEGIRSCLRKNTACLSRI